MKQGLKWGIGGVLLVGIICLGFYLGNNAAKTDPPVMPQQTENTQPLTTDVDREKIEQLENAMDEAQKKINEILEQIDADAKSKQEILEQLIKVRDEFKKQVEEKNINE